MVNVVYDERKWRINLDMDNGDCPYLYYPANLHCCRMSENEEEECTLEKCAFRVTYE